MKVLNELDKEIGWHVNTYNTKYQINHQGEKNTEHTRTQTRTPVEG